MEDNIKCTNNECPLRGGCDRFSELNDEIGQWYSRFNFSTLEKDDSIEYSCEYLKGKLK